MTEFEEAKIIGRGKSIAKEKKIPLLFVTFHMLYNYIVLHI